MFGIVVERNMHDLLEEKRSCSMFRQSGICPVVFCFFSSKTFREDGEDVPVDSGHLTRQKARALLLFSHL